MLLEKNVCFSFVLLKQISLNVFEHHQLLQIAETLQENVDQTLVRISGLFLIDLLKTVQIAYVLNRLDVIRLPFLGAERVRLRDKHLNYLDLMRL